MSEGKYGRPTRMDRLKSRLANTEPPARRADIRRASLVEAAGALFVENGVEATTVDEVAARAGVAKGTFYHYFDTKADLLDALRAQFSDEFLDRVLAAVGRHGEADWNGRLTAWITAAVDAYFDMRALHDVVFHGAEMPLREAMGDIPLVRNLTDLLAAGDAAGIWAVDDPASVSVVMFHGLHGAVDETIVTGRTPGQIGEMLARLYLRMIAA
ncbi:TetR/AcrR family transcriptional regulator [Sphingomonas colocasiae]|uniref:TetR/AcrR family transcriptional regulator n=1 Tax=Sphingomonas colocasiae TaxID=1848973 RepID=A0ABS7PQS1_9SPHN|nr:TetR/AcrR family transcriptional regulator [Sphingomonas colocasiae]MBY8823675.1 TetR/AcrR family transcriptional regulator [Sphingomonas colocasiae]